MALPKLGTPLDLAFPPQCVGCETLTDGSFSLCPDCWRDTPFIGGVVCDQCGAPQLGASDTEPVTCDDCLKTPRPWDHGRAAMLYKDKARRLTLAFKYGDRTDIARAAAKWLARAARPLLTERTLIAPVPLHWSRLFARRYNQAALLSAALAKETGHDHCPDVFIRPRRTATTKGAGIDERHTTLTGSIEENPRREGMMTDRDVLIVDDVMTTGATFAAAATAARRVGARQISVLALARRVRDT